MFLVRIAWVCLLHGKTEKRNERFQFLLKPKSDNIGPCPIKIDVRGSNRAALSPTSAWSEPRGQVAPFGQIPSKNHVGTYGTGLGIMREFR